MYNYIIPKLRETLQEKINYLTLSLQTAEYQHSKLNKYIPNSAKTGLIMVGIVKIRQHETKKIHPSGNLSPLLATLVFVHDFS